MIIPTQPDDNICPRNLAGLLTAAMLAVPAATGSAQTPPVAAETRAAAAIGVSPPPPVAPAVITRDERKRATIRAVRISQPLTSTAGSTRRSTARPRPIDGFIQQEPSEGAPATEKTEVWVLFDDTQRLRQRRAASTAIPSATSSTSCAATTTTSRRTRASPSSSTRSSIGATGSSSRPRRSARCAIRRSSTMR